MKGLLFCGGIVGAFNTAAYNIMLTPQGDATQAILAYIVIDAIDIEKFWEFSASGDNRADLAAIDSIARDFQKDRK